MSLLGPVRPLEEFLDLREFEWPKNLLERIDSNARYYSGNYEVLHMLCMLILCLVRPVCLVGLVLALGLGYWMHVNSANPEDARTKALIRLAIGVILMAFGGTLYLRFSLTALVFAFAHAMMRKRTVKNRTTTFLQRAKENLMSSRR